ncbi:MAG: DUF1284 domain-containing protein [Bacillota bacterium]
MIRLRGHHLVCLQFFRGEGYDRVFIENLQTVVGRAVKGEEIEVVEGPDDVCRACPSLEEGRCSSQPAGGEANIRELDEKARAHLGIGVGERVLWREVFARVSVTSEEWFAGFCEGCEWEKACVDRKKDLNLV